MTAADFVRGEPFLLYLGDNVLLEGVTRFVEEFERNRPDAQILLTRVPEPEHFGVAVLEGERVVRLVEKPTEFVSDIALVGVYLFDDSILEAAATSGAVVARRVRDHRGDPVAGRPRPDRARGDGGRAGGRTPASPTTCWRPTG